MTPMINPKMTMNERLRHARIAAGFATATDAIEYCGWKGSTYRAHENGQNNFKVDDADRYGKAYGVSIAWLLIGDDTQLSSNNAKNSKPLKRTKGCSPPTCPEKIQALALLLKDEPTNLSYVEKLKYCLNSYYELLQRND